MNLAPLAPFAGLALLAAGMLLGMAAVALHQRLNAWRAARAQEWDPY